MEGLTELPKGASLPGGPPNKGGEEEVKRSQEEQMRRDVMATVLDTGARERRMFYAQWIVSMIAETLL